MPRVAQFTVLPRSDGAFDPNATPSAGDFKFDLPANLDRRSHAVVFFRANPDGNTPVRLRMRLSVPNTVIVDQTFDTSPQRSWNEIIPPGALVAGSNELIVSATGEGRITISDIVFLYHIEISPPVVG